MKIKYFEHKCLLHLFSILTVNLVSLCFGEPPVTGRCARPGLPSKAQLWLISPERSRFDNKEKVLVHCKKDEFPQFKQELECRNGRWVGDTARCGENHRLNK